VSEIALANSRRNEPPGVDQIPAGATLHSEMNKLIYSDWNKENCLSSGRHMLLAPIYKNSK
jgi:hypothetical protein